MTINGRNSHVSQSQEVLKILPWKKKSSSAPENPWKDPISKDKEAHWKIQLTTCQNTLINLKKIKFFRTYIHIHEMDRRVLLQNCRKIERKFFVRIVWGLRLSDRGLREAACKGCGVNHKTKLNHSLYIFEVNFI